LNLARKLAWWHSPSRGCVRTGINPKKIVRRSSVGRHYLET
jgi:hypothetical protein